MRHPASVTNPAIVSSVRVLFGNSKFETRERQMGRETKYEELEKRANRGSSPPVHRPGKKKKNRGIMGLLYSVWGCSNVFIAQFYMISISAISYSISESMTGLSFAIQKILPKKYNEDTELEENHNESLCRTLKRTEDAYDDLCNCCSTYNEVFGFSEVLSGSLNSLLIWISFYALVMVAAACESVHRAARDVHRHLALFNSEIYREDKFLEVRVLARDVLHAVSARQPRLSACGLFDLRMSLVTAFLSLIATYSIVLLQFTHLL
ncbi:hypothetical protein EVAR_57215_1 [Eumeta japonica]|uniref:Gustatory receptor n=1 Tax=Eumeta variegata TaxID=151549 RepID=A0A4C1YM75_EUMVA|nr:hypothetical protein EVAR_57215_1 [Eumeta japonica]